MRFGIGLCLFLVSGMSLAASPRDVFVFNHSDRLGYISVEDKDCKDTDSCDIPVGGFVRISEQTLQQFCPTDRNCQMFVGVEGQDAVVSIVAYNHKEGVLYATQSKWVKYRVEKLTDEAIRIYVKPKNKLPRR